MENKRKNVYITIFVITTVIAGVVALYFCMENTKLKNANNTQELKQEEHATTTNSDIVKGETVIKEVVKEAELSQENIDKIAQATIETYFNLHAQITASPENILITLGFYNSYQDFIDNTQNLNGVEKTSVKYEDFVNKITKYMTKEMFENGKTKFTSYSNIYKNLDGYLAINAGGASGYLVHVSNCKLQKK